VRVHVTDEEQALARQREKVKARDAKRAEIAKQAEQGEVLQFSPRFMTFASGTGAGLLLAACVAGLYIAVRPNPITPTLDAATARGRTTLELAVSACADGDYAYCIEQLDVLAREQPASVDDEEVQKMRANAEHMMKLLGSASPPPPPPPGSKAFDPYKVREAVTAVTDSLSNVCSSDAGPNGAGHVKLTFASSGTVTSVEIDLPFDGTAVGKCIVTKLRAVRIAPFEGESQTVGKNFLIR
jgi:hypothetical protein